MYEKAKAESGIVRTSKQKSKTAQEAFGILTVMKNKAKKESDKEYLKSLCDAISWDSIPAYYIKKIARLNPTKDNALAETKAIIPDSYLITILEKDRKIDSEPETVLLAEELI